MPDKFSTRSCEPEMLDAPGIPQELLFQNLKELELVNKRLGGHSVTLSGLKQLLNDPSRTYHIVDIGCGGGDAMREMLKWAKARGLRIRITGVDMNPDCIAYMRAHSAGDPAIEGVVMDYREYLKAGAKPDIIHCSLFCHHLRDEELEELFIFMKRYSRIGFIVNDLHRHWFAYYSIHFLTRLLRGSALVKNDAPLSVLRGFKKKELSRLLEKSQVRNASISWRWAFRFRVLVRGDEQLEKIG